MSTDNPQENKTVAENKSHPVDEESTFKPRSIAECNFLRLQINKLMEEMLQLPHPPFSRINELLHPEKNTKLTTSRDISAELDTISVQLKALQEYQKQLTRYGNYFEKLWIDVCACRQQGRYNQTFEQAAAEYKLLRSLADALCRVTRKNVAVGRSIDALKTRAVELRDHLSDLNKEPKARDTFMQTTPWVRYIQRFAGHSSLNPMRLVKKSWKLSLERYETLPNYPFAAQLNNVQNIHKNLLALSRIRIRNNPRPVGSREYRPLVFYYCCINSKYAEFAVQNPMRYGITLPQAYLLTLYHGGLKKNSIQELIRLQIEYPDEFTSCYFIKEVTDVYYSLSLLKNFITDSVILHMNATTRWQKFLQKMRFVSVASTDEIAYVMMEQWGWVSDSIKAEEKSNAHLESSLKNILYFIISRSDFGLPELEENFLCQNSTNTNLDWYVDEFSRDLFFHCARTKTTLDQWRQTYEWTRAANKDSVFSIGFIACLGHLLCIEAITYIAQCCMDYPQIVPYVLDRYLMDIGLESRSNLLLYIENEQQREQLSKRYADVAQWLKQQSSWFFPVDTDAIVKKVEEDHFAAVPILFNKIANSLTSQQLKQIARICIKNRSEVVSCIIEAHGRRLDIATKTRLLMLLPKEQREEVIAYLEGINHLGLAEEEVLPLLSAAAEEKMQPKQDKRQIEKSKETIIEKFRDDYAMPTTGPSSGSSSTSSSSSNSSSSMLCSGSSSSHFFSGSSSSNISGSASQTSHASATIFDEKASDEPSRMASGSSQERHKVDLIYINGVPVSTEKIDMEEAIARSLNS